MLDDVAVPLPGENPSAEARMAAIVHGLELDDEPSWNPSAEGFFAPASSRNPSAEGFATRVALEKPCAEVREPRVSYHTTLRAVACGGGA
jgi:hypothetical protein